MKYKSAFFVTILFILVPSELICQPPISFEYKLSDTPSIELQVKLDDTYSTGIKIKLEDIHLIAAYSLYKKYPHLTDKQKQLALINATSFVKIQTALFLAFENNAIKVKTQIAKKNSAEYPNVSFECSHPINKQININGHALFYINDTPEFTIGTNYTSIDKAKIQVQGLIKNNKFSHASLSCLYPITNNVGIKGDVFFDTTKILYTNISAYNPTKSNPKGFVTAMALNTGIPCLCYLAHKEAQIYFSDKEYEEVYAQNVTEKLDQAAEELKKLKAKLS